MKQKCHGIDCNTPVEDDYYCPECFNELQEKKQKQKQKPNEARLIRQSMFG